MAFRKFIRFLISLVAAVPLALTSVNAAPLSGIGSPLSGVTAPTDVIHVAGKKKKKKQRYVKTENGRYGQLIGKVGKSKSRAMSRRDQKMLAGMLIGTAVILSGGVRHRGYHGGGRHYRGGGRHCAFYDTPNPYSGYCR